MRPMRPTPLDPRDQEPLESADHDRRPTTADRKTSRDRRGANRATLAAVFGLLIVIVLIALL